MLKTLPIQPTVMPEIRKHPSTGAASSENGITWLMTLAISEVLSARIRSRKTL